MQSLFLLVDTILSLYTWVIIISVILSWLVAFNIVNTSNRFVSIIGDIIWRLTEPVMGPIRRMLPNMGGIDLSPLVVLLLIFLLRNLMREYGLLGPVGF
ncbi:YggT family protein [Fodinicurvata sp. EGI_FJ10296]|uniref:YggT family protein n=1 Tax=Fodinicurvata sp. EGI_FJ10296 TaxID=3231908 RepID=UPI0034554DF8